MQRKGLLPNFPFLMYVYSPFPHKWMGGLQQASFPQNFFKLYVRHRRTKEINKLKIKIINIWRVETHETRKHHNQN